MRKRLPAWLLPFGSVTLALFAVAACEDPDGSSSSGGFDGSTGTFEAGTADVVTPPAPEAGPDASAPVTLSLVDKAGKPLAGITVVFGSAAGDVLGAVVSSAAGLASFPAPSGSQVTVIFGTETDRRLVTIVSVEPGDTLVAVDFERGSGASPPTLSIPTVPAGGPDVTDFRMRAGSCANVGSLPLDTPVYSTCVGPAPTLPVFVEAVDGVGLPVGFTTAKGIALPTDGGTVVPALGAWSTTFATKTVIATNLGDAGPATVTLAEIASGVAMPLFNVTSAYDADGGTATATYPGHDGFPDAIQAEAQTGNYAGSGVQVTGVAVRANAAAGSATTTVDFGTRLPAITTSTLDAGGAPTRPAVGFTPSAPLTAVDGIYVYVRWTELIDGGQKTGAWTFVLPPSATSVVAPSLPAGTTGLPSAQGFYSYPARVVAVEASFVNGYAELRKGAGALVPTDGLLEDNERSAPALPKNGTLRYTAFVRAGD